jgi:expansin (peptidoglycan-binding protein)
MFVVLSSGSKKYLDLIPPISDNGQHIDVTVGDLCPGCGTDGIDLSIGAFASIENLDVGRMTVSWSFK